MPFVLSLFSIFLSYLFNREFFFCARTQFIFGINAVLLFVFVRLSLDGFYSFLYLLLPIFGLCHLWHWLYCVHIFPSSLVFFFLLMINFWVFFFFSFLLHFSYIFPSQCFLSVDFWYQCSRTQFRSYPYFVCDLQNFRTRRFRLFFLMLTLINQMKEQEDLV